MKDLRGLRVILIIMCCGVFGFSGDLPTVAAWPAPTKAARVTAITEGVRIWFLSTMAPGPTMLPSLVPHIPH